VNQQLEGREGNEGREGKKMATGSQNEGYVAKAVLSHVRVSPQKARLVIDLVRGKPVGIAIDLLTSSTKKTAPILKKLILSAAANAKDKQNIDVDELVVKRIWVNEGRKLKRFIPRAHGRAAPIIKRSSTITVLLDEQ
jgi:large subunit ribosomal protein L22